MSAETVREDPNLDVLIDGIITHGWHYELEADGWMESDGRRFIISHRATLKAGDSEEVTVTASTPHAALKGAIRGLMAAGNYDPPR